MSPADIAAMPNDMIPAMRYDPAKKKEVPIVNPDGSVRVGRQAFQVVRMRRGFAYTRKLQWFTDEFPQVYGLVKRYGPVSPTISYVEPDRAYADHADAQPAAIAPEPSAVRPEPLVTLVPLDSDLPVGTEPVQVAGGHGVVERSAPVLSTDDLPPSFKDILA